MARATLLDLAKLNPDQLVQGIIEEAIAASPELKVAVARFIPGTEYRTIVHEGLPATSFRDANQGVDATKSTFENRLCQCHILAARVEADQAIADAYVDGAGCYQALEAVGVVEAAYQKVGVQFYYGTENKTVDAGAAAKTNVWFVKFGEPSHPMHDCGGDGQPLFCPPRGCRPARRNPAREAPRPLL